jgi:superfamily II helicase
VDTTRVHHDDTVEAHYFALERPCMHCWGEGWVELGYEDDDGEYRKLYVPCRRCSEEVTKEVRPAVSCM